MNRRLILFLASCTLAAAMVPRDRRAVNTEEEEERLMAESTTSTTTEKVPEILYCAKQTPCAWSLYKPVFKYIEMNITNTYCTCSEGTICQVTEEDTAVNAYVLRCRPPAEPQNTTDDTTDDITDS